MLKDNEEGGEEKSSTSSDMKGEKKSDSDSSTLHRELQIQFDINLSLNEVSKDFSKIIWVKYLLEKPWFIVRF